jgi:PAS domain S-box-containing protein
MKATEPTVERRGPLRQSAELTSVVKILLVDDNPDKRFALRCVLEPLGFGIVEADSGMAALRCILAEDFAVILLDVCMPVMDGFETAALIRQRRQNEMTPIIFITAYSRDEIPQADHYTGGAVDFIFAPVPPAELRAKVSVFANLFMRADSLAVRAREVQATANQLRLLTDAAPIGIFQTDVENRYVYTNPGWTDITGIEAEGAVGRPWDMIISPDQRPARSGAASGAAVRTELSLRFELPMPGAAPKFVHITAKRISDGAGGSAGWVGTLADVTAVVGAEAAMSAARDTAVTANAMQRNFTASASHELRTPTTSILGFVEEVLEGDGLTDEDRGYLDIVLRNAQRLSQLIDDLLIIGEAEVGITQMALEPTPLVPLLAQIMATFSRAPQRDGVTLVLDDEGADRCAMADSHRLEQALTNLISNALKFSAEGGEVTVRVRGDEEEVQVSVTDSGMGIDPADVASIFERFFRTKLAIDTSVKGSGLGLAIAKEMIEAQHGTIGVTSEVGRGSTFTITLPTAGALPEPSGHLVAT